MSASALLEAHELVAGFGVTTVLHGVSLTAPAGKATGIFGLNGAGKSVTMKVLAGVIAARSGSVRLDGEDITSLSAEARVARGMGHVPQGRQVFPELSVAENLRLGAYVLRRRDRSRYDSVLSGVLDRFPLLAERKDQLAGTMSGGQQASLAVARALMSEPRILFVDEPSAGLSPIAVMELGQTLKQVASSGVTMVLVEQNVSFGLGLVDTAHVLQTGRIVYSGAVGELDADALAGYLGIGRLLSAGVGSALGSRTTKKAPAKRPAVKKAPVKKAPAKAVAKKAPAKTPAKRVRKAGGATS